MGCSSPCRRTRWTISNSLSPPVAGRHRRRSDRPAAGAAHRPAANPALIGAVRVPDGTVDPFRLTAANMLDAREHGAQILTYHPVVGLLRSGDRVTGVRVYDHQNQRRYGLHAPVVVNAAGIWGPADRRIR